jgi:hypothetical protein
MVLSAALTMSPALAATSSGTTKREQSVYEAVFRSAIQDHCQVIPCVVSVHRRAVTESLMRKLESSGRVYRLADDDFVTENGATRAFSKRGAQILDVRRVRFLSGKDAQVDISIEATAMGASMCRLYLALRSGAWVVLENKTECTV